MTSAFSTRFFIKSLSLAGVGALLLFVFVPMPAIAQGTGVSWTSSELVRQQGGGGDTRYSPAADLVPGKSFIPQLISMSDDGSKIVLSVADYNNVYFVSSDGGATWRDHSFDLGTYAVSGTTRVDGGFRMGSVSPNGAKLYAVVHEQFKASLKVSTDMGTTWNTLPFPVPGAEGPGFNRQYQKSATFAGRAAGLYPISDNGEKLLFVAYEDSETKTGPCAAGRICESVWISHDSGATWTKTYYIPTYFGGIAPAHSRDGKVILLASDTVKFNHIESFKDVLYSTDGGMNWKPLSIGPVDYVYVTHDGATLFVGRLNQLSQRELYKSVDGGASWQLVRTYLSSSDVVGSVDGGITWDLPPTTIGSAFNRISKVSKDGSKIVIIDKSERKVRVGSLALGGALTASPAGGCALSTGATTCPVTINWNTKSAQYSVLQGAGSLWPAGANIEGPTTNSTGVFKKDLPVGSHAFSVSGFNGMTWVTLGSLVYKVTGTPTGALSISPAIPCASAPCSVTISWNTGNSQYSIVQGSGVLWPTGVNLIDPTTNTSGTIKKDLPVGDHAFSVSGFDGAKWVTLGSVSYKVGEIAKVPAPSAPVSMTAYCNSPTSVTLSWPAVSGATTYYPRIAPMTKAACDSINWQWQPDQGGTCYTDKWSSGPVVANIPLNSGTTYKAWVHAGEPVDYNKAAGTGNFVCKDQTVTPSSAPTTPASSMPTGTTVTPTPTPAPSPKPTSNRAPGGYFDNANCSAISGWAYDPDSTEKSLTIQVYEGDTFVIGGVTNINRGDVNRVMKIAGDHGFSIPTPAKLKDGKEHVLRAYAIDSDSGSKSQLTLSPRTITCGPATAVPVKTMLASVAMLPLNLAVDVLSNIFLALGTF